MERQFSSATVTSSRAAPWLEPFTATWLRARCDRATCRDPSSGQRLVDLAELPVDTTIREVAESADTVTITFAPDGHRSTFSRSLLTSWREYAATGDGRTELDKQLWAGADLARPLARTAWSRCRDDPGERAAALRRVRRIGFTLLTATPTDDQTVAQIAETFSYVRETNYGWVFDVRATADANHLADTSSGIAPHTDNPYRDPVPTIQLLQCLTGAADGGESGLLDGFQAASLLRRLDPDAFDVLTSTLVTFRREEPGTTLR